MNGIEGNTRCRGIRIYENIAESVSALSVHTVCVYHDSEGAMIKYEENKVNIVGEEKSTIA